MATKGQYKTIVMDPPWSVSLAPDMSRILQGSTLRPRLDYQTMSEKALKEFDLEQFAAPECLLFLWCTNSKLTSGRPCLQVTLEIVQEWGFNYRMLLVWHKSNGWAVFSPFRGDAEFVVFASRRISKLPPYGRFSNVFSFPSGSNKHKHSEKPAGFYQMLRECTPEPRIDLFARRAHEGFDGWGQEYVGEGPLKEYLTTMTS